MIHANINYNYKKDIVITVLLYREVEYEPNLTTSLSLL